MAETPGGAGVGHDAVAQLDRLLGGGDPAEHGGGVEVLAPQGGVGRLPAALGVGHAHQVGDQDVVVRAGVAGPGGGVAGDGVDEALGRGALHRPASPAAHGAGQLLQIGQGGVALGVHDPVHVLGPADDAQLGHGLVGRDDQLQARAFGVDQALARRRITGAVGAEETLVLGVGDRALQAEGRGTPATPQQRRLASGGVVGQGLTGVVVAPGEDRGSVVVD